MRGKCRHILLAGGVVIVIVLMVLAVTGAVPAALGLQVMPTIVAYYLGLVAGKTPVRIFLLLAGVLFMCYIAAFSLLIGAAIAARRERSNETLALATS